MYVLSWCTEYGSWINVWNAKFRLFREPHVFAFRHWSKQTERGKTRSGLRCMSLPRQFPRLLCLECKRNGTIHDKVDRSPSPALKQPWGVGSQYCPTCSIETACVYTWWRSMDTHWYIHGSPVVKSCQVSGFRNIRANETCMCKDFLYLKFAF